MRTERTVRHDEVGCYVRALGSKYRPQLSEQARANGHTPSNAHELADGERVELMIKEGHKLALLVSSGTHADWEMWFRH